MLFGLFYSDPLSEMVFNLLTTIVFNTPATPVVDVSADIIMVSRLNKSDITINDIGVSTIDDHLTYGIEI